MARTPGLALGRSLASLALAVACALPRTARAEPAPCCAPLPPCRVGSSDRTQQEPDCSYAPPLATRLAGPRGGDSPRTAVRVDTAHRNIYTAAGLYWPFARLAWGEGFDVLDSGEPLDQLLSGTEVGILVIAGAGAAPSPVEVQAVVQWVESGGGGLLLVFDHSPLDAAINLLQAFLPEIRSRGRTYGGQAVSVGETAPSTVFLRPGSLRLGEHDAALNLIAGNDPEAPPRDDVARVETYEGVALLPCPSFRPNDPESCAPRPPEWSPLHFLDPLLVFPEGAQTEDGQDISGHLQGFAFRYGAGRVYVSGEGAMFTAQRQFYFDPPPAGYGIWGMQESDNDNARLLSNILHWLAGPASRRRASGSRNAPSSGPAMAQRPSHGPVVKNKDHYLVATSLSAKRRQRGATTEEPSRERQELRARASC